MAVDPAMPFPGTRWLKRLLGALLMSGFAALLIAFITHRLSTEDAAETVTHIAENTSWTLNNIHHTATRNGKLEWQLDAGSARYSDTAQSAVLANPSVTFFQRRGKTVALTGKQGILDTDTKNIRVSDRVTMAFAPYILETDALHYLHASRQISTEGPVTVSGRGITIQADTMVVHLDSETILLNGHVKGMLSDVP